MNRPCFEIAVVLVAATVVLGCDTPSFIKLDGGSGIEDAGEGRDAGFGEVDGGPLDAGPLDGGQPDAGQDDAGAPCVGQHPVEPWPCEPDTDFCDALGDAAPRGDVLMGWSRYEPASRTFLVQLRWATPIFAEGPMSLSVLLREEGSPLDTSGDGLCEAGFNADECKVSQLFYVERNWPYIPSVIGSRFDSDQQTPDSLFNPCDVVFIGVDRRSVELRIPEVSPIATWWLIAGTSAELDTPDGSSRVTFVPSSNGAQDDVEFTSICELTCPSPDP